MKTYRVPDYTDSAAKRFVTDFAASLAASATMPLPVLGNDVIGRLAPNQLARCVCGRDFVSGGLHPHGDVCSSECHLQVTR